MNKVALICWITVFTVLMVGQVSGQNYQITWHNSNLEACQILDQNNYYVAGWNSTTVFRFMKSNDAGQTWQSVEVPSVQSSFRVTNLWMIDSQTGWICGHSYGLYQTTDGGQTWIDASNRPGIRSSSDSLMKIKFISPQIGYIMSSGDLKKTTNGGQTWTTVKTCQVNAGEGGFLGFDVVGETILITAGRYNANNLINCHVSQDGGQTWQLSYVPVSGGFFRMKIASPNIFYASADGTNMLYRTTDGGKTWSVFLNFPNAVSTSRLALTNNQLYVVVGYDGYICIWKINNNLQEILRLHNIRSSGFDIKNNSGLLVSLGGAIVTFTDTTVTNDDPAIPAVNPELTCYPNPFKSGVGTTFKFQTDHSPTTLAVYNIRGQLIRTLKDNELLPAGEHEITWDGKTDSGQTAVAGVYLCKLRSGKYSATRKVILVR